MPTASPNPVVAIAADAREFTGLLRHASAVSNLAWPITFSQRALIHGNEWLLVANGPGPRLAGEAAQVALRHCHPLALLSTGFCGGLDPLLETGAVFVASEVRAPEQGRSFPVRHLDRIKAPHISGVLLSQDRVASTASEKSTLHAQGAHAVEMEAAAVAREAERSETGFYCVRVVSDGALDEFPLDFNRLRDHTGRFSRGRIAAAILAKPWVLTRLIHFDAGCRRAAIVLGDFLADCRFHAE